MRIISGKYKGLKLDGYDIDGTRPTMDRVKESLFGIIQNEINGSICLDLFAGSGSLGLEALSNGANTCYFVDSNKKVIEVLKNNTIKYNITDAHILHMDYISALKTFTKPFDIIFLDPPYKEHLIQNSLNTIMDLNLIKDGIIICEYEDEPFSHLGLELIKEKRYGNKNIKILKRTK